jgi:hypothetical protein
MGIKGSKPRFDWELIYAEYRSDVFTDAELARRHGCSRTSIQKRVIRDGWVRDLSASVRRATIARMVKEDAGRVAGEGAGATGTPATPVADSEIVERAAAFRQGVIQGHRRDVRLLRELEVKLLAELDDNPKKLYLAQFQGRVVQKTVGLTAAEKAAAANNLANVQHKRIQLERQSYSLDDAGASPDAPDSIVINFRRDKPPKIEGSDGET